MKDVKELEFKKNSPSASLGSHSGNNVPANLPQSRIACDMCGKYFYTTASLKMHSVRTHGNKVQAVKDVRPSDILQKPQMEKVTSVTGKQIVHSTVPDADRKDYKSVAHKQSTRISGNRGPVSASSALDRRYPVSSGDTIAVVKHGGKQVSTTSLQEKCKDCGRTVNMAAHKKCDAQLLSSPQKIRRKRADQRKRPRQIPVRTATSEGILREKEIEKFRYRKAAYRNHSKGTDESETAKGVGSAQEHM